MSNRSPPQFVPLEFSTSLVGMWGSSNAGALGNAEYPFIAIAPRSTLCPVGWGCRIHRLLLCRGVRPPPNECPGYDTKQSDGEVPAMLELWGMQSTPSLPSLPGPLWPGVVAPDKGPIYGLNRTKPCFFHYTDFLHLNCVFMLNWIVWNRTVLTLELRTSAELNCSK